MTAPAIAPAAPAQAEVVAPVVVPAVEQTPVVETPKDETFADRMARIGRKLSPEAKSFADQPASTEVHPGSQGSVLDGTPPITAPVTETTPTAEAPPSALVKEIAASDPDGDVILRSRDTDGRFTEMDQAKMYELAIKDKQTGETKVYTKTLPELMRMAKDGVSMMKSRDELTYYRENTPKWQENHRQREAQFQSAAQELEQYKALTHQLLIDPPEEVDKMRERYQSQFTPENRVKQLEAELAAARQAPAPTVPQQQPPQQTQPARVDVQQAQAFGQRTAPVLAEVEQIVGREAAVGQMALFTMPLLVNGQIPPERLADVEAYIHGPYREWAKSVAAGRTTAASELEKARQVQVRAQQAAQNVGAATRPTGGTPSNAPVQQAKPRTREEAISRIVNRPVQATG